MKYWDEYWSKYSFHDGDLIPADAEPLRAFYAQAVNHVADHLGSKFRVLLWDRPGMHNYLMYICVPVDVYEAHPYEVRRCQRSADYYTGALHDDLKGVDEAFNKAVAVCEEAELDDFVQLRRVVDAAGFNEYVFGKEHSILELADKLTEEEA